MGKLDDAHALSLIYLVMLSYFNISFSNITTNSYKIYIIPTTRASVSAIMHKLGKILKK